MPKRSAGILLYRHAGDGIEVLLVHPGGPFWAKKDVGAWSIPKGEYADPEDALVCARREFEEETGLRPQGDAVPLGEIVQRGGKHVTAFAMEGDFDLATLRSNTFDMEWPPKSGRTQSFPEVDRAAWFSLADARSKILPAQAQFIDKLVVIIGDQER
jgi:predicted NUDIX family NTP pyrophosphohydrolase